jgi:hypothetical protein
MASSMITNTITNVTKSNVILENPADWHEWMIVINHKAESGEVKQLIDPDLTTEPILLREPDRPKPSDIKAGVTTTVALTAAEREEFRFQREDYKIELVRYQRQRDTLNNIKDFIITSVARQHLSYLENKTTVYQMLTALKKRIAPTDRARKIELARRYRDIQQGPVNQDPDRWLTDWEKVYTDAVRLRLPEVQEEYPLYDFLNAIRNVDKAWTAGREAILEERIRRNESLPTIYDIIEDYRNHQRISQATSRASPSYATFATFRGEDENGRVKRWDKCLCGEAHTFRECLYLIEGLRTADWYPSPDTQKEIDHKLANIPKLKAAVERAQKEMRKEPREKPPDKPQKRIGALLSF